MKLSLIPFFSASSGNWLGLQLQHFDSRAYNAVHTQLLINNENQLECIIITYKLMPPFKILSSMASTSLPVLHNPRLTEKKQENQLEMTPSIYAKCLLKTAFFNQKKHLTMVRECLHFIFYNKKKRFLVSGLMNPARKDKLYFFKLLD